MPAWNDLSQWMKVQVAAMVCNQWSFLTFNPHIHTANEAKWVSEDRDPRIMFRDRLRHELNRLGMPGREFYFVVEGWSDTDRAPTFLHIHGAAAVYEAGDEAKIKEATARAAGHRIRGAEHKRRAEHIKPFTYEQAAYATYLFKASRRFDPRLRERRLTMSRSMVQAASDFWKDITGRPHD